MQTGKKKNVGVRRTPQYLNKPIQLFPRSTVYWALLYTLWGPQTDTISPSPCPKAAHKAFGSDQLIRPLEPKTGFFSGAGFSRSLELGGQDLSRFPGHRAVQEDGLGMQRKGWETVLVNTELPWYEVGKRGLME